MVIKIITIYKSLRVTLFTALCIYGLNPMLHAQEKLSINDTVPSDLINRILGEENGKRPTSYDGIIVNFWATWCVPCIEELQFLNSIIPKYPNLEVISVTYESQETVQRFLSRQAPADFENLSILGSNTELKRYFPHHAVPHNVWINSEGVIDAITGSSDMTESNIQSFLSGEDFQFIESRQSTFNHRVPMSVPDSSIVYRSFFQPYREEVGYNGILKDNPKRLEKPAMTRFHGWNVNATQLFWAAYGMGGTINPYLLEVRTRDSLRFFYPEELDSTVFANSKYAVGWPDDWTYMDFHWRSSRVGWMNDHIYSYELIYKDPKSDSAFNAQVIRELELNLKTKTSVEMRRKDCIAVTITDRGKSFINTLSLTEDNPYKNVIVKTEKGRHVLEILNANIDDLINWLRANTFRWTTTREEPYVNRTGLKKRFSTTIELTGDSWRDVDYLEAVLTKEFGLIFTPRTLDHPVLVIEDLK